MFLPGQSKIRPAQDHKRHANIRSKISRTEQRAAEAMHELKIRLSPPYIKGRILRSLYHQFAGLNEKCIEAYQNQRIQAINTFRNNPLPSALIGLGIFCFLKNSTEGDKEGTRPAERQSGGRQHAMATEASFISSQKGNSLQTKNPTFRNRPSMREEKQTYPQVRQWNQQTGQPFNGKKWHLQKQSALARQTFLRRFDHHSLALGAIMLTMGVAVAAVLPPSRKEFNRWETRGNNDGSRQNDGQSMVEEVKQNTKYKPF